MVRVAPYHTKIHQTGNRHHLYEECVFAEIIYEVCPNGEGCPEQRQPDNLCQHCERLSLRDE